MGAVLLTLFQGRKKCLEDAPIIPGIPPAAEWVHFSGGLLPNLVEEHIAGYELVVLAAEEEENLRVSCSYNPELFESASIQRILWHIILQYGAS